jgi:hypothetical protein
VLAGVAGVKAAFRVISRSARIEGLDPDSGWGVRQRGPPYRLSAVAGDDRGPGSPVDRDPGMNKAQWLGRCAACSRLTRNDHGDQRHERAISIPGAADTGPFEPGGKMGRGVVRSPPRATLGPSSLSASGPNQAGVGPTQQRPRHPWSGGVAASPTHRCPRLAVPSANSWDYRPHRARAPGAPGLWGHHMSRLILASAVATALSSMMLTTPGQRHVHRARGQARVRSRQPDLHRRQHRRRGHKTDHRKNYRPKWSPDGKRIAYVNEDTKGVKNVYVITSTGSGRTKVTNKGTVVGNPSWSPDGKQLAFAAGHALCTIKATQRFWSAESTVRFQHRHRPGLRSARDRPDRSRLWGQPSDGHPTGAR